MSTAVARPDLTSDLRKLSTRERLMLAREALECDQVLSESQLRRHYDLKRRDLKRLRSSDHIVTPVHARFSLELSVRFYGRNERILRRTGPRLAHLAGTAEVRHVMGAAPAQWKVEARGNFTMEEPDAVWWPTPDQVVAVEYDYGAYRMSVVRGKYDAFVDRGFDRVVWAVPSKIRAARLKERLKCDVEIVKWWE